MSAADYSGQESEVAQDLVILRTAQVLPKKQVDAINVDLHYLQHYHDALYDALCLALIIDPNKIVAVQDVSLLHDLSLINEYRRMKDAVEMVLEARLLDRNTNNPCPYQERSADQEMCIEIGNSSDGFNPER